MYPVTRRTWLRDDRDTGLERAHDHSIRPGENAADTVFSNSGMSLKGS